MPSNPLCLDVKTSPENCPQLKKKMGSSGLEQAVKVRKPYTITKQRERWNADEHNKFLEALKLYGRAWRQIEEHVGTKTAVQIRSHAQKFFSKVVRESSGDDSAEVKAIEIPPPRPKRKPMHPYPRKLGNSASMLVMEKPKWSFIPKVAVSVQESLSTPPHEEDNQAPASVPSAVGSNTFSTVSPASELMSSCVSPVSSAVGSDPVGTSLSNQEHGCQSATTTVDDEDIYLMLNGPNMELYSGTDASVSCEEALSVEAPASSLKLFGKTMVVPDPHKQPSCADAEQCHQSPSYATDIDSHSGNLNTIQHLPDQVHEQSATDGTPARPAGEGRSSWNLWSGGGPAPMLYVLPTYGHISNSAEASVASMPWMLAFCGGALPFMVPPQNLYSEQDQLPSSSCCNASSNVAGGIGSSDTSVDGAQNLNMSSKLIPSKTSAFRSLKATSNKPSKGGFVPYRRCVPEKNVDHQKMCVVRMEKARECNCACN